ncbi:hypothetical protein EDB86DRAFT_3250982 [Lactarius hatsudake]|nr:hypothetical protein EDB86DRAFT_3250982 [Lactarius hatsudake]
MLDSGEDAENWEIRYLDVIPSFHPLFPIVISKNTFMDEEYVTRRENRSHENATKEECLHRQACANPESTSQAMPSRQYGLIKGVGTEDVGTAAEPTKRKRNHGKLEVEVEWCSHEQEQESRTDFWSRRNFRVNEYTRCSATPTAPPCLHVTNKWDALIDYWPAHGITVAEVGDVDTVAERRNVAESNTQFEGRKYSGAKRNDTAYPRRLEVAQVWLHPPSGQAEGSIIADLLHYRHSRKILIDPLPPIGHRENAYATLAGVLPRKWSMARAGFGGCEALRAVAQASAGREISYTGPRESQTRLCRRAKASRECGEIGNGNEIFAKAARKCGTPGNASERATLSSEMRKLYSNLGRKVVVTWAIYWVIKRKGRAKMRGDESRVRGELSAQRARESEEARGNAALRKRTECRRAQASERRGSRKYKNRNFIDQGVRGRISVCMW